MIRKATPADIPALVALSIEALNIDRYDQLVISPERIRAGVEECVTDPMGFAWVSENEQGIQGGLGAIVLPLAAYERNQAQVVMWYCKIPGDGIRLLRKFREWVSRQMLVKQVMYVADPSDDGRVLKLFNREMSKLGKTEILPTSFVTR